MANNARMARARRITGLCALLAVLAPPVAAETVVFEAGLGDGAASFRAVARQINAPTVLWTRPNSLPTDRDGARSGADMAAALHDHLIAENARPPFVLVAHSIGSMSVLAFAALYPSETSGIVLVDARLPRFAANCVVANAGGCAVPQLMLALMPRQSKLELAGFDQTAFPEPRSLRDIPIHLLVSSRRPTGTSRKFAEVWQQTARDFAAAHGDATLSMVQSGHYIHHDAPGAVVSAIATMLDR